VLPKRVASTFDFGRSKNDIGHFDFKKKGNPGSKLWLSVRLISLYPASKCFAGNPKFQLRQILEKTPIGLHARASTATRRGGFPEFCERPGMLLLAFSGQ